MENTNKRDISPVGITYTNSAKSTQENNNTTKKNIRFSNDIDVKIIRTDNSCTPADLDSVSYKIPSDRVKQALAPPSSITRPNYEDILKRVAVVLHTHIQNCEKILKSTSVSDYDTGAFHFSKASVFSEENYVTPQYVYHFIRSPITKVGFNYTIRKVNTKFEIPKLQDVHTFLHTLFVQAQLSPECSIVCLIYVERLMEVSNVPLLSNTWRPCVICGLLLASKVWQDLSSWNSEISSIYPEFSLAKINILERTFCVHINWELFISSSLYAKYYFALRSLTEKHDFRRNYNAMMLEAPKAKEIAIRTQEVKENIINTTLSKSV